MGNPDEFLDLDDAEATDLQLGCEDDWPTFRRLKAPGRGAASEPISSLAARCASFEEWPEMFALCAWQWGFWWGRGVPWLSRGAYDLPANLPAEMVVAHIYESAKWLRSIRPVQQKSDTAQQQ